MSKKLREDYPHLGEIHSRKELKGRERGKIMVFTGKGLCIWKLLTYLVAWKENLSSPVNSNLIWRLQTGVQKVHVFHLLGFSPLAVRYIGRVRCVRSIQNNITQFLSKSRNTNSLLALFNRLITSCTVLVTFSARTFTPGIHATHKFKRKVERSVLKPWSQLIINETEDCHTYWKHRKT